MNVLFVDDDPGILEQAKEFIETENDELEVETTNSPKKALEELEKNSYNAIVSDYQMPEMDGLDLLEKVRNDRSSDIPFIVFTGKGREEVAMEALNLGADRYLQKRGDPRPQYSVLADAIFQEVESWNRRTDLEKSKEETQILLDNFPAMFFIVNRKHKIVKVNKTMADFLGSSKKEIEGKFLDEVFSEEKAEEMKKDNKKVVHSEDKVLRKIEPYKTDEGTKWTRTDKRPMRGENGEIIGVIGFARDITERKKSKEREDFLHSLLRHDVGNKIQIALGYQELLEDYDLSDQAKKYIEKTIGALNKSKDIIEKVSTLRKLEEEDKENEVGIRNCIKNAIEENKFQAKENDIQIEYQTVDCEVLGGQLLKELFSRIIENSIIHSGCNKIRISVEENDVGCIVKIEDDGCGIENEDKENIFEKGFKKGKNSGSGLGTYLAKEIAEIYGGSIEVKDSNLGGVRFDVHLQKV